MFNNGDALIQATGERESNIPISLLENMVKRVGRRGFVPWVSVKVFREKNLGKKGA